MGTSGLGSYTTTPLLLGSAAGRAVGLQHRNLRLRITWSRSGAGSGVKLLRRLDVLVTNPSSQHGCCPNFVASATPHRRDIRPMSNPLVSPEGLPHLYQRLATRRESELSYGHAEMTGLFKLRESSRPSTITIQEHLALGLQVARSRSCLCTSGPKAGSIKILCLGPYRLQRLKLLFILYHIILFYILLYFRISYHIILYYIILYYIISHHIILYFDILYYIILHYIILSYIILYHIILYYITLYYIILYYIILYYIILYYIILYYIILYYIILYYIILYYIILYCIILYCIILYFDIL